MKKSRIASRIAWTRRIATMAVIMATVYVAATTLLSMSVSKPGRRSSSVQRDSLLLPSPITMSQGTWTITGVPFALTTSVVSDQNLEASLAQRTDVAPASRTASVLEGKLINRIKQLATRHEVQRDTQIFYVHTATIRARLFVAGDPDVPCVQLARVAYRRRPGEWTVVEADCLNELAAPATEEGSFLPLPESARTIGRRFDAEGRLQTHLVSVSESIDELAQRWAQRDWKLRREILHGQTTYLCQRKTLGVHVIEKHDPSQQGRLLLIVRTTNSTIPPERIDT